MNKEIIFSMSVMMVPVEIDMKDRQDIKKMVMNRYRMTNVSYPLHTLLPYSLIIALNVVMLFVDIIVD